MKELALFTKIAKNIIIGEIHNFNQVIINDQKNIDSIKTLEEQGYIQIIKCETKEIDEKTVTIINGNVTDKGIKYIKENKLEVYNNHN
ncbi:hypothetical protein AAGC94_04295 [Clostridium sporogenes]|uniref:hypothetical protein n=1 Tax=Clostridium sporogenes TaxID=1509 RepID=UPI00313D5093